MYAEDNIGDFAYTEAALIPENADLSTNIIFENGIQYSDVIETRRKMRRSLQGRNTDVSPSIIDLYKHNYYKSTHLPFIRETATFMPQGLSRY